MNLVRNISFLRCTVYALTAFFVLSFLNVHIFEVQSDLEIKDRNSDFSLLAQHFFIELDDSFKKAALTELGIEIIADYDKFVLANIDETAYKFLKERDIVLTPAHDLKNIKLRHYTFDTSNHMPSIPSDLKLEDSNYYILQFIGPIKDEWIDKLKQTGVTFYNYIPNYAYVVKLNPDSLTNIKQYNFVRWLGIYQPAYKIGFAYQFLHKNIESTFSVLTFEGYDVYSVAAQIIKLGGTVSYIKEGEFDGKLRISIPFSKLHEVARIPQVAYIEEYIPMKPLNDDAQWVLQSAITNSRPIWDYGLRGENQIIGICDTGLRVEHIAFEDTSNAVQYSDPPGSLPPDPNHRKVVNYHVFSDTDDYDGGHGTHTGGTLAGDDEPNGGTDPYDGMALKAKLSVADCMTGQASTLEGIPGDLNDLFIVAYNDGARIHSNSWGGEAAGEYTMNCMETDQFMWNYQDFLVLYSAGNEGPGIQTMGSPAAAKNAVTVGGCDNGVAGDVWVSSSRGPAADGRLKPTVMAPYRLRSAYDDPPAFRDTYATFSGTSMSCPAAAGVTALIRQYFTEGWYPTGSQNSANSFEPSGALMKAMLINTAVEMDGSDAYTHPYNNGNWDMDYPSNSQGWGRPLLDDALYFSSDSRKLAIIDDTYGLVTGDAKQYEFYVSDDTQSLKITLVWTDYWASPNAAQTLVNDLNLKVTAPDGSVYKGNVLVPSGTTPHQSMVGGIYDTLNVEEQVIRVAPQIGTWKVEVIAYNIPKGPQPFSIVVTGGLDTNAGRIYLDKPVYSNADTITITVEDGDATSVSVDINSTSQPSPITVTLTETGTGSTVWTGTVETSASPTAGKLYVQEGDLITANYTDLNPSGYRIATALADCSPPVISDVWVSETGDTYAIITWTTDEPANSTVYYGTSGALGSVAEDTTLTLNHKVKIIGLQPETIYYFDVASTDRFGFGSYDDNNGLHYKFSTVRRALILFVDGTNYTYDCVKAYTDALSFKKWPYSVWTLKTDGLPPLSTLQQYYAVIWETGEKYPQMDAAIRQLIKDYEDGGGRLFVSSHDVGWDQGSTQGTDVDIAWYNAIMKADWRSEDATTTGDVTLQGIAGDPISGDYTSGVSYTILREGGYEDEIATVAAGGTGSYVWKDPNNKNIAIKWVSDADNGTAGVGIWGGTPTKLVYFAFIFPQINAATENDATRADILDKVLRWLIDDNVPPDVTVLSPNGGEIWSGTQTITWSSSGTAADTIDLQYSPDGGQTWYDIVSGLPGTATGYNWDTTTVANSDTYRIKVIVNNATGLYGVDTSDANFTVDNQMSVTVLSPNGGEQWYVGEVHNIEWTISGGTPPYECTLNYSTDGGVTWNSIPGLFSASPYSWTIPNAPSTNCYVRVIANDSAGQFVIDISDAGFSIIGEPSVTLDIPNGGEQWFVGDTYNIEWTISGGAPPLEFTLNYSTDGGVTWTSIPGVFSASPYSWTIPNEPSSDCLVRINVSDANNHVDYDISDSTFLIVEYLSVTLDVPNGGEEWYVGEAHNIEWTTSGGAPPFEFTLNYSTDGGATWTSIPGLFSSSPYSWIIPNTPSSDCYVRVIANDSAGQSVIDISDAGFSIIAEPEVTVISPNGGETWIVGTTETITWSVIGGKSPITTDIYYSVDGGLSWTTIATGLTGTSYSWLIPNTPSTDCYVMANITDANNHYSSDTSDSAFSINQPLSVILLTPNGGEAWQVGTDHYINWTIDGGIPPYESTLNYSTDGGATWNPIPGVFTGTSYLWTVPNNPSADCYVKVIVKDSVGNTTSDLSDSAFTITTVAVPDITVISPNGGEVWYVGNVYEIKWTASGGTGTLLIGLNYSTDGGSSWIEISGGEQNDGVYSWTIPNTPSTDCLIRANVTDENNAESSDKSDLTFTIAITLSAFVIAPNGGEDLYVGQTFTITWSITGGVSPYTSNISYSTDNGTTWSSIATGLSGTSYSWLVPNTPSVECLIKIDILDSTSDTASDTSNSTFSIFAEPYVTLTIPNGGEQWYVGNTYNIEWTISGGAPPFEFTLNYSTDGGTTWTSITGIFSASPYSWTIPYNPSTDCWVRINVSDANNHVDYDMSDNAFSIVEEPSVTITSPNGGELWLAGTTETITWTISGGVSPITTDLYYSTDGGLSWTIIAGGLTGTSYSWTIPNTPSTNCYIMANITDVNNHYSSDTSDSAFTIIEQFAVNIITPDGGECWFIGDTYQIEWSISGGTAPYITRLNYSIDGGITWLQISGEFTTTSMQWTVPNTPSTDCYIRANVTDSTGQEVSDTSNSSFVITERLSLSLISPDGGELWYVANTYDILWAVAGGLSPYSITLLYSTDGGNTYTLVADNITGTSSYRWAVPNTPSSNCYVKAIVFDTAGNIIVDTSNSTFTIVARPFISVITPDGGENWYVNRTFDIIWNAGDGIAPLQIDLLYSTAGVNGPYYVIAQNLTNTGTYQWLIPNTPSTNCYVKAVVKDVNNISSYDKSDSYFMIHELPIIELLTPNGGEIYYEGDTCYINWSARSGVAPLSVTLEYSTNGLNGPYKIIVENLSADYGFYPWLIFGIDASSANCIIRAKVIDTNGAYTDDTSNNTFTIYKIAGLTINFQKPGWYLISIPFELQDNRIENVLASIDGKYDKVEYYDASDANDHWKVYSINKPDYLNDLKTINYKMGFWLHITASATLNIDGVYPLVWEIELYEGWNLIGYPYNQSKTVEDAFGNLWMDVIDRVQCYDSNVLYNLTDMTAQSEMHTGCGYWVHCTSDTVWRNLTSNSKSPKASLVTCSQEQPNRDTIIYTTFDSTSDFNIYIKMFTLLLTILLGVAATVRMNISKKYKSRQ